jgi:hypothetical protein
MQKIASLVFALPLVFAPALFGQPAAKPGSLVARWPIKTSIASGASLTAPGAAISLSDFLALPPAADHRDTAHESERYAKPAGAKFGEGDIVRTRGYIRLVAGETDGDYHMQISETADTFDNCLVVEVPKDEAEFVKDSTNVLAAAKVVRAWVIANLLAGQDPRLGGVNVMQRPAYVEITGQLFFDSEHQAAMSKNDFRGKSIGGKQLPSKTSWEIHPVTNMTFAPVPK